VEKNNNKLLNYNENIPIEWKRWHQGESYYKPFSLQMRECKENGNLFMEDCCHCNKKLLLCKKHGGQCVSNKCRGERIKKLNSIGS
jgi:hypothetical protein